MAATIFQPKLQCIKFHGFKSYISRTSSKASNSKINPSWSLHIDQFHFKNHLNQYNIHLIQIGIKILQITSNPKKNLKLTLVIFFNSYQIVLHFILSNLTVLQANHLFKLILNPKFMFLQRTNLKSLPGEMNYNFLINHHDIVCFHIKSILSKSNYCYSYEITHFLIFCKIIVFVPHLNIKNTKNFLFLVQKLWLL